MNEARTQTLTTVAEREQTNWCSEPFRQFTAVGITVRRCTLVPRTPRTPCRYVEGCPNCGIGGPQQRHTGVQQFTQFTRWKQPNFSCVQAQRGAPSRSRVSSSVSSSAPHALGFRHQFQALSGFVVGFVIGFVGQWIPSPSGASSSHTGRPHSSGRRPKTCLTLAAVPTS